MVLGPPGTGKTTRLLAIAASLAGEPGTTTFVSHTRAAARELASRAVSPGLAGTIHSLCYRELGIIRQQVVDSEKFNKFAAQVGLDPNGHCALGDGDQIVQLLQSVSARMVKPEEAYATSHRPCSWGAFKFVHDSYASWKKASGLVDFNDMLALALTSRVEFNFDKVYVDEAQDLTPLQWRVIAKIAASCDTLVIAGDDDQAIFEWAGADAAGIAHFIAEYGATTETLTQSFRVPKAIFALAARILSRVTMRIPKSYKPTSEDGRVTTASGVQTLRKESLSGCAILYRDLSSREDIEDRLIRDRVPFVSLSGAPAPWNGIYGRAARWLKRLAEGGTISSAERARLLSVLRPQYARMFETRGITGFGGVKPGMLFDAPPKLADYLDHVDLVARPSTSLSTIHNYKGAEADRVVLMHGLSDRVARGLAINPDQEHRVFYVGVTRARHELVLVGGQNEYPI